MLEKTNKIVIKKILIRNLSIVRYWLEKNINKEDTLNKLYYIILIYIKNDKNIIDITDITNISKYAKKKILQKSLISKKDINEQISKIFINNNIEILEDILIYDKNINYFDKVKDKHNLYFDRFDLEIRFLPNFLKYEYTIILIWISCCIVIDKKNTNNSNNFLHDIYLFQNEKNNIIKMNYLIIILEKMTNYIQYFDYKNVKK